MGDFNYHIKDLRKRLHKEGLQESIPQGVETHNKGNQLDQIFSNVETISWETYQLRLKDHKLIIAKLRIKYQDRDLKLSDKEKNYRVSDISKQCWRTYIDAKRELFEEYLENAIQKCFEEKLEKHSKTKHWYNQPPDWVLKGSGQSQNNQFSETKSQWNEAIRDMEQCLERNDVKGFFYMVKRLTKSKKQSEPIKGLTISRDRVKLGEETQEQIMKFFNQLYKDLRDANQKISRLGDQAMMCEDRDEKFCIIEEVERSIRECNFNKAIGPDGFHGKMLTKSEKTRKVVSQKITKWINSGTIPQYLKEGRLILLSKNFGDPFLKSITPDQLW
ncbi:hypothetical protein OXYTRIMIC_648 [Oxytricha trifallax]|uniref:Endonuclease-reverse transcriptase n=1 Tax=Oxytricha trifallax TaxID=1172189 RepID=A0A073HZV4_9SPIT|nr:hypothetical protein OXYTRIMIC_648 [Oxytricha trifallax]